jgi:3-deoxy-7-phosphoheptulonate synthase
VAVFKTAGNEDCHLILRGGKTPTYGHASVEAACADLAGAGLRQHVMVDFSHANSSKQYRKQSEVGADVAAQLARGERRIIGVMVEGHINPGRQDLVAGKSLEYGVSITDACLGWDDTVRLLDALADGVRKRRVAVQE